MTDREKLAELLDDISYKQELSAYDLWDMREAAELIADFLIANGVTVQQCKKPSKICPSTGLECISCVPGAPCAKEE